jgi:hypothetical protein
VSVWFTEFYGGMKALQLKAADPRLQKAEAQSFEHQVVCPAGHYSFPGGEDLGGAAGHHTTKRENNWVEGEIAGWAVADLVIGEGVRSPARLTPPYLTAFTLMVEGVPSSTALSSLPRT